MGRAEDCSVSKRDAGGGSETTTTKPSVTSFTREVTGEVGAEPGIGIGLSGILEQFGP